MDREYDEASPSSGEDGEVIEGAPADEVKGVFNVPNMAMGQVFAGDSSVTSMDFHEDGELCVLANADK